MGNACLIELIYIILISNQNKEGVLSMDTLFIINTDDAETIYNAMRLANVAVEKGDEVNVFMLGKGVLFEQVSNEQFNIKEQIDKYKGNMYV